MERGWENKVARPLTIRLLKIRCVTLRVAVARFEVRFSSGLKPGLKNNYHELSPVTDSVHCKSWLVGMKKPLETRGFGARLARNTNTKRSN